MLMVQNISDVFLSFYDLLSLCVKRAVFRLPVTGLPRCFYHIRPEVYTPLPQSLYAFAPM